MSKPPENGSLGKQQALWTSQQDPYGLLFRKKVVGMKYELGDVKSKFGRNERLLKSDQILTVSPIVSIAFAATVALPIARDSHIIRVEKESWNRKLNQLLWYFIRLCN